MSSRYNFRKKVTAEKKKRQKIELQVQEKKRKNKRLKNMKTKSKKKNPKPLQIQDDKTASLSTGDDSEISNEENEKNTKEFDDALDEIESVDIKKYKKKTREQQRKDFQKFYDRRFFQVLRKQTIRRFTSGYRIRYTTLDKYKLKKEYLAFLEKQIGLGNTEYQAYVTAFEDEKIYEDRLQNKVVPYENETEQRVVNVMRSTGVGANINPAKIVMVLDPKSTPGAKDKFVNVNPSQRENFVVQKAGKRKPRIPQPIAEEADEAEMMMDDDDDFEVDFVEEEDLEEQDFNPKTPGVVDEPRKSWEATRKDVYENEFNLPYTKYDITKKKFTYADAVAWFKSREYLVMSKSGNIVEYLVPQDVRKNKTPGPVGDLRILMDILGCIQNDPRYWKPFAKGATNIHLRDRKKAREVIEVQGQVLRTVDGKKTKVNVTRRVLEPEDKKPLDKMVYKQLTPQPVGSEDLLECFKGDKEEVRQKSLMIISTPARKTGLPAANFNKQRFSAIQALARPVQGRMKNPFRELLQSETLGLRLWTDQFTSAMTSYRNEQAQSMAKGVKKSVAWKTIMVMLKKARLKWMKLRKTEPKDKPPILRKAQAHMDYISILLYCLKPSVRDDYAICKVIKGKVDAYLGEYQAFINDEGIVLSGSPLIRKNNKLFNYYFPDEQTFVFQRFKTQKDYKQRRHFLKEMDKTARKLGIPLGFGALLAKEIKSSLQLYPRDFLVAKPHYTVKDGLTFKQLERYTTQINDGIGDINTSKLSKSVSKVLKTYITKNQKPSGKYGINLLRHATVSFFWRQVGLTLTGKQILANYMLHTKDEAEKTYNWALRERDLLKNWKDAYKGIINLRNRDWVRELR